MSRTSRSVAAAVLVLILAAALAFIYASPYIALNRVKRAADARDAQTVNEYVDFPALRASLKEQVGALLTRRVDIQKSNPLAIIGAMIGAALVGPLVDSYATPDGVAAILNGIPPRGDPGEQPPPAGSGSSAAHPDAPAPGVTTAQQAPKVPPQTTAGYRSLNTFVVTYQHGAGDARYSAIFHRYGLVTWKLVAVDLNG
ncbi:membrane protein [Caballeronia turbans]|uniref:DUF2939 domain-containing protein n=1 Tax=Caballeronia sp. INML2 TaxID=2921748 RepID=UPI00074CBEB8|nr:DUF2939 domain-containing protein [Caballeronia sp. INML2]SAL25519.1 membrane protein [Caballeronia turbans]